MSGSAGEPQGELGPAPCAASQVLAQVLCHADLLGAIFQLLSFEERLLTLPLVCTAWAATHRRGGLTWQACCIDGEHLGAAGPGQGAASSARFWRQVAAWLTPQRAASVRRLELRRLPAVPAGAEAAATATAAAMASVLARLGPSLQELAVAGSAQVLPPPVLAGVGRLTALKRADLVLHGAVDSQHLDGLAAASGLEDLTVTVTGDGHGSGSIVGGFPRRLTALPRLRRLALRCAGGSGAGRGAALQVPESISKLQGLRSLELFGLGLRSLPESLGALTQLEELCLGRNALGATGTPGPLPESITQLQRLRRLELQWNGLDLGPPLLVGDLTSLEELNLAGNQWGDLWADPPAFRQLTALRYLTLTNCGLRCLPPAVLGMASLRLLKININAIEALPEGPYLGSLESIDLAHNRFACYPPALSLAPNLLDISFLHGGTLYTDHKKAAEAAATPAQAGGPAAGAGPGGDAAPAVTAVRLGAAP